MRDARFPLIMRASRIHDVLGCSPDEAMRLAKEEREANERDEAIDMLNEIAKVKNQPPDLTAGEFNRREC